jgi:protocatechuate 3,4-dioxygenase beta subunit
VGRVWIVLAVLAATAVVGLYLAGSGSGARASGGGRPARAETPDDSPAAAPGAPSLQEPKVAHLRVGDKDGQPVAGATVRHFVDSKPSGPTATTGSDGRCTIPLPDGPWAFVSVRHPDFVAARAQVEPGGEEQVIVLERGPRFAVLVLDPSRKPVAGVDVAVRWERTRGAAGFWRWSDGEDMGEFTTDADGLAVVGAVPEALITVRVDRQPFALHESRVEAAGDAPIEHLVRLDAGGVLVGKVVGPGGEGVPGALVSCQNLARPTATSGPAGEFRLEAVAPGSVQLVAAAEGFGPGFFGSAIGWGDPVPIPLRSGETLAGLEIVLSRPVYVVGRIVDEAGAGVAGVTVYMWTRSAFAISEDAPSDADGRFRVGPFSVRAPGQAWVSFHAPLHTIQQVRAAVEPGKDLDLGEVRATSRATVRGTLVDEAGHPVEGNVDVLAGGGSTSKPDGTFELRGVGPGEIVLVGEQRTPPVLKSKPLTLQTVAGQTVEGVEIVLSPTKPIGGRVITPEGRPRPGAILGARAVGATAALDHVWSDTEGRFTFKDLADGEYDIGFVGTGQVLWGSEHPLLPEPPPVRAAAGREDLEFIFPMKGGVILGKVVAKREGTPVKEFAATFIRYKLFVPSDSDYAECRGGEFRYETDEPGTWQVDVSAAGFAPLRTEKFSLAAGEVKDLGTLRLGPGGTIAGTVLDAQQRPVPYARINILNDKLQTNEDEPYSDLEGRFSVPGVSPGFYTVFAVSPRHPLGMVRGIAVKEGETTNVQIAFVEPAPLTVEVRDASGQPVEGAALDFTFPAVAPLSSKMFRPKIPPGYGSHVSDPSGTILQPCLPPGEVTITIEAKGFEPVTKKLELKPGEPNRVEVRLRRAGG